MHTTRAETHSTSESSLAERDAPAPFQIMFAHRAAMTLAMATETVCAGEAWDMVRVFIFLL